MVKIGVHLRIKNQFSTLGSANLISSKVLIYETIIIVYQTVFFGNLSLDISTIIIISGAKGFPQIK